MCGVGIKGSDVENNLGVSDSLHVSGNERGRFVVISKLASGPLPLSTDSLSSH